MQSGCVYRDQQAVLPLLPLLLLLAALKHGQVQTSESSQTATDTAGKQQDIGTVIKGTHRPCNAFQRLQKQQLPVVKGRGTARSPVCTPPTGSNMHISTIRVCSVRQCLCMPSRMASTHHHALLAHAPPPLESLTHPHMKFCRPFSCPPQLSKAGAHHHHHRCMPHRPTRHPHPLTLSHYLTPQAPSDSDQEYDAFDGDDVLPGSDSSDDVMDDDVIPTRTKQQPARDIAALAAAAQQQAAAYAARQKKQQQAAAAGAAAAAAEQGLGEDDEDEQGSEEELDGDEGGSGLEEDDEGEAAGAEGSRPHIYNAGRGYPGYPGSETQQLRGVGVGDVFCQAREQ